MGVKLYNSLPYYIKKESNNIIKFESILKKFLLGNTLYSLDEFLQFFIRTRLQIILSLFIHIALIYKQRFFTAIGLYFITFAMLH